MDGIVEQVGSTTQHAIDAAADPGMNGEAVVLILMVVGLLVALVVYIIVRERRGTQEAKTKEQQAKASEVKAHADALKLAETTQLLAKERESQLRNEFERNLSLIADVNERYDDMLTGVNRTLGEVTEAFRQNTQALNRNSDILERYAPPVAPMTKKRAYRRTEGRDGTATVRNP